MKSKYKPDLIDELENEILDIVSGKPISEIEAEFKKYGVIDDDYVISTRSMINEKVQAGRKQMLLDARKQINRRDEISLIDTVIKSVDDAQAFLFNVVSSGKLQQSGFTAAFREGESIPDQDLIDFANQVRELIQADED